ncbi:MAG: nuclear transport factor 2 family protein [Magnetococcales bacterium]|nr:nuclear transport factor 2 family protein [Magnetococcales bacterium]
MDYSKLANNYFQAFARKDIDVLARMFHPGVVVTDWEHHVQGRDAVLALDRGVFESFEEIKVNLLHLHEAGSTVVGELEILLNRGALRLKVVDVITFDETGVIRSIRAYKG